MKFITFVRHAKSSWDSFSIPDHDRPLNNRGQRDSVFMGKKLSSLGFKPQIIICSSAKRAQLTAKNIAKSLSDTDIIIKEELYDSYPADYIKIIGEIDEKYSDVMMVGHNPTMTDIVNYFSPDIIYNVPTTGVFKIQFDVEKWIDISFESGKLIEFIYPKMFKHEY